MNAGERFVVGAILAAVLVLGATLNIITAINKSAHEAHRDSRDRLRVECQMIDWEPPVCEGLTP